MSTADTHGRMSHGEPEEPHGVTVQAPHHHVNYIACFLALVGLTVATVLAYYVFRTSESELLKILVALAIAAVKATVVAMFFMHLKFEGKLIYTIAIVPLILCVLLVMALIPDVLRGPLFNNRPVFHPAESAAGGADAPQAEH